MTDYTLKEKANAFVEATESYTRLKDERDELLEALKWAMPLAQDGCKVPVDFDYLKKYRAIIKKVEK